MERSFLFRRTNCNKDCNRVDKREMKQLFRFYVFLSISAFFRRNKSATFSPRISLRPFYFFPPFPNSIKRIEHKTGTDGKRGINLAITRPVCLSWSFPTHRERVSERMESRLVPQKDKRGRRKETKLVRVECSGQIFFQSGDNLLLSPGLSLSLLSYVRKT